MATTLEMEALNLVNEDPLGPTITDEQKYKNILAKKKDRRCGEQLFDFLHRQITD